MTDLIAELRAKIAEHDKPCHDSPFVLCYAEATPSEFQRYCEISLYVDDARAILDALERAAEWEAERARILAEQCAPDEKHCACVPVLRAERDRCDSCAIEPDSGPCATHKPEAARWYAEAITNAIKLSKAEEELAPLKRLADANGIMSVDCGRCDAEISVRLFVTPDSRAKRA